LALLYFYLEHPSLLPADMDPMKKPDKVMPYFYSHQLPLGLGGLVLASFLCDAMQTLVSGVNSISAIATKDVFERIYPNWKSLMSELALARVTTVVVGLVATVLAASVARGALASTMNIFDLLPRTFNMFLGPLSALFMIGMFVPRARARTAIAAVLLCMLFSFCWSWWPEIPAWLRAIGCEALATGWTNILGVDAGGALKRPTIMLAIAAPCVAGVLLGAGLSWLEPRGEFPGQQYTWWSTIRRPVSPEPER
jgi:SSS family solute:Na+ symporter